MDGSAVAIFADPDGNAGYMSSDFYLSGKYYSGINMWQAETMLVPSILVRGLKLDPTNLNITSSVLDGTVSGNFGYGTGESYISGAVLEGNTASIPGQEWGLYNLKIGDGNSYYNPTDSKIGQTGPGRMRGDVNHLLVGVQGFVVTLQS